jgi:hypothetical protein
MSEGSVVIAARANAEGHVNATRSTFVMEHIASNTALGLLRGESIIGRSAFTRIRGRPDTKREETPALAGLTDVPEQTTGVPDQGGVLVPERPRRLPRPLQIAEQERDRAAWPPHPAVCSTRNVTCHLLALRVPVTANRTPTAVDRARGRGRTRPRGQVRRQGRSSGRRPRAAAPGTARLRRHSP